MDNKIRDTIRHCIISQNSRTKFFGDVAMLLDYEETNAIPTMGVCLGQNGRISLKYNKKFVESLTYEQLEYVLLHEIAHIALNHIERMKEFKDTNIPNELHNIAADAAANSLIGKPPFEEAIWPPNMGWELGLSYEKYLNKLLEQLEKEQSQSNNQNNGGKSKKKEKSNSSNQVQEIAEKIYSIDSHEHWNEIINSPQYSKIRNEIRDILEKQKGSLPGDFYETINASFKGRVNWKIRVRHALNTVFIDSKIEPCYYKQNRRFPEYVGIIPGKKYKNKGKLLVFLDTSGSMSEHELKEAMSYVISLPYEKEIYMIDAQIQNDKPIKIKGIRHKFKLEAKGRGGTDFRPAFELAKKKKAKTVLFFTDLYGTFPDKSEIPKDMAVYWVQTSEEADETPPFGQVFKMKEGI